MVPAAAKLLVLIVFLEHCAADPNLKSCGGGEGTGCEPVRGPGQSLLQHRFATTKSGQGLQFIASPVPEHWAELQGRQIDTSGMLEAHVTSPSGDPVVIKTFDSSQDVYVSGMINAGSGWESAEVQKIYSIWRAVGKKGNLLDVGANIGSWSLPIASMMKYGGSKVIAVEAMPSIADHLRAGIVANEADNVILFPYALGAPVALNEVEMALSPTNKGGSAVVGNKPWTVGGVEKFQVGMTTIDAMLEQTAEMQNVLYCKMDIEGNEGRAIAGGQEFFSKHPPCVLFMELNPDFLASAGTSVEAIEAKLNAWGYDTVHEVQNGLNHEFRQKDFNACVQRLH